MNIKTEKYCVSKIILDSITFLIIAIDLLFAWFYLNLPFMDGYTFRFLNLFILIPIIQIINVIVKNKLSNIVLFLYEIFLAFCNIMQFSLIHYESDFVRFATDRDAVFDITYMSDWHFYFTIIFLQPLIISIVVLLFSLIIKSIIKTLSSNNINAGNISSKKNS